MFAPCFLLSCAALGALADVAAPTPGPPRGSGRGGAHASATYSLQEHVRRTASRAVAGTLALSRSAPIINIIAEGPRESKAVSAGLTGAAAEQGAAQSAGGARPRAPAVARFARRRGTTLSSRMGDLGPALMDIRDLAKSASQLGGRHAPLRLALDAEWWVRPGDIYQKAASDLPSESEKRAAVARETAEFLGRLAPLWEPAAARNCRGALSLGRPTRLSPSRRSWLRQRLAHIASAITQLFVQRQRFHARARALGRAGACGRSRTGALACCAAPRARTWRLWLAPARAGLQTLRLGRALHLHRTRDPRNSFVAGRDISAGAARAACRTLCAARVFRRSLGRGPRRDRDTARAACLPCVGRLSAASLAGVWYAGRAAACSYSACARWPGARRPQRAPRGDRGAVAA